MIDGILLVDKGASMTSYDVIRRVKKYFPKGQKIGHAGTLDPFATGLLILLFGKGTKLMTKFLTMEKEYLVKAEFGYETDTQDRTGEVINSSEASRIRRGIISREIKKNFLGDIEQTPPIFSAKKIEGKKAYELARKGEDVKLSKKRISVSEFKIIKYNWPFCEFRIRCSSGTYVRTLINDLGKELGTFATAVELRRSKIGSFDVKYSIPVKDFSEYVKEAVIPLDKLGIFLNEKR
jgi:tRNA pseudouridine55 synthase